MGMYGQCAYQRMYSFSDSYMTDKVSRECLPEPFTNYLGQVNWKGESVDLYAIYSAEMTQYRPGQDDVASIAVQLRALRQPDGSCFPVEVEMQQIQCKFCLRHLTPNHINTEQNYFVRIIRKYAHTYVCSYTLVFIHVCIHS